MTFAIIFDSVGVGEWFVLLAVVLIVVGPKRLPSTARKFGQYYSKFKRAADGFKRQLLEMDTEFTNAVSEAEKEVEQAASEVEKVANETVSDLGVDPSEYGGYDPYAAESAAESALAATPDETPTPAETSAATETPAPAVAETATPAAEPTPTEPTPPAPSAEA